MLKPCLALRRRADIDVPDGLQWLTPFERIRHDGFGSVPRCQTFLAGRWLLRQLLARIHGGAPETQAVEIDAEGRSSAGVGHVNVSHSGDWCVAAWAETPIGVDVETLRPRADLMAIAERVASERECAQVAAAPEADRLQDFYRLWTLKEAWLKSQGQGLDFALMRTLEFAPAETGGNAACAHLPRAGLQLALCGAALGHLPGQLAGETLAWQRFSRLAP